MIDTTYPPKKLLISHTVYPQGGKKVSPNTGKEWYGIVDDKKKEDESR